MAFGATYDAYVLCPVGLRDLLVRLAMTGLFRARWTEQILDEMVEAVRKHHPQIADRQLEQTC